MSASVRTPLRVLTLPYEALRTIYEGGSEVREYRNEITGHHQVGKRIDVLGLEETVAFREATLLTTIDHKHVVPVDEVVNVSGYDKPMKVIELIMPYYASGSVFDLLYRGHRFSVAEARQRGMEALLGMAEIHEQYGILHRDLKSPNVLIDDTGRARVGDLGVAMPMEADGTAEAYPHAQLYSPPETFATARVSRASDLYQLGLVLFEMVNGPFDYEHHDNLLGPVADRLALGRRGPRPRDIKPGPHVPKRMRAVLRKALEIDPGKRYQSATDMADALRSVRMVDWSLVVNEDDRRLWEGHSVNRPDRIYRIEARAGRRGGWVLSARQRVNVWQRVATDQVMPRIAGGQATTFFDAIVDIATKR